jgi:DNA repair protein RecO (recombination protein O)
VPPLYRDEAVVLRNQRLVPVQLHPSRFHGRLRAVAKGVRRTGSKFGARCEPFSHIEIQLATGRSFEILTQVQSLSLLRDPIAADYPSYTAGSAMLETAERLTSEEGEPAPAQFTLLVGALRALAGGDREPRMLLDSYLLRALAVAGWAPSFDACALCGDPGPHRYFAVAGGGMVCVDCRNPGSAAPSAAAVALLAALLAGDWPTASATAAPERREASGLVAAYLSWHLERGLRSLPLVERA